MLNSQVLDQQRWTRLLTACNTAQPAKSKMAASWPQNGRRGSWVLLSTLAKQVFDPSRRSLRSDCDLRFHSGPSHLVFDFSPPPLLSTESEAPLTLGTPSLTIVNMNGNKLFSNFVGNHYILEQDEHSLYQQPPPPCPPPRCASSRGPRPSPPPALARGRELS